jgi:uncharacterized membrane protein
MSRLPIQLWIILCPVLLIVAISALLPLFAGVGARPPDEKWRGLFYSNPDDPALLIPKRYGIGYTLNFSNRWSWFVLLLILLLVLVPVVLSVGNVSHLAKQ